MTATQIDSRTLAENLGIDTFDLAAQFRLWASDALVSAASDLEAEFVEYDRLTRFEERVDTARRQILAAVEAEKAYHEDNPLDPEDAA